MRGSQMLRQCDGDEAWSDQKMRSYRKAMIKYQGFPGIPLKSLSVVIILIGYAGFVFLFSWNDAFSSFLTQFLAFLETPEDKIPLFEPLVWFILMWVPFLVIVSGVYMFLRARDVCHSRDREFLSIHSDYRDQLNLAQRARQDELRQARAAQNEAREAKRRGRAHVRLARAQKLIDR